MSCDDGSEGDEDCLEFIDPRAEERAKAAEAAANKEKDQKPKMVKINGKMVMAHTISMNGKTSATAGGAQSAAQNNSGRSALFSQLRNKVMQKQHKAVDLEQVTSTFKTQDLQSKKKNKDEVVEDALANDIEKGAASQGDDVDDEDYEPFDAAKTGTDQVQEVADVHNWDDEENIKSITEGDIADCVQSSEDVVS